MPRLAGTPGDLIERLGMLRRLARERERLALAGNSCRRARMHGEVALYLAPFLRQKHREQELGTQPATEQCEQASASAGAMPADGTAMLREKASPDLDVPVLDFSQPQIQGLLAFVRLRGGEDAIEKCGVGLVLPVMLEGMQIRSHESGGHA